jgi:4-carboxymuconolactone decarboxylase
MVARHYDCDYEWSVHAPIARQAGVSTSVLEAIGRGLMPNFDNDEQADIYRYTDALLNMHDIGDEAFFAVKARFGERGIVDLAAIVGYYGLVAGLLNSVRAAPLGEKLPQRQK